VHLKNCIKLLAGILEHVKLSKVSRSNRSESNTKTVVIVVIVVRIVSGKAEVKLSTAVVKLPAFDGCIPFFAGALE
jgi:hypothetical protein